MTRKLLALLFAMALAAGISFAGETTAETTINSAEVEEALKKLQGMPGLEGANAAEMNQFVNMLQSPEMARVASRLSAQLAAQGNTGDMNMDSIAAFVRQNLTKEDIEAIMGQSISSSDYQQAVTGGDPEAMKQMLERLQGTAAD